MHLFKMTYKYISNITRRKYGKPPGAREKKERKTGVVNGCLMLQLLWE